MKSQDFCYKDGDGSVDLGLTWYSLREEQVLNVMRSDVVAMMLLLLLLGSSWGRPMLQL